MLARPGLFLNTSSDATLLRATLEAAVSAGSESTDDAMLRDASRLDIEPLFVRGISDTI